MNSSDEAVLERWVKGHDAEDFRTLVQRHAGMVYATCRRILRNDADAEDATQECFETLAQAKTATGIQALGPWLHGMATKHCLMRLRSERRRKNREAEYMADQNPHAEIKWNDIYDRVDEAISDLPQDLRTVVVSHYLYGMSHAQVARQAGIPRRTVSDRIKRGVDDVAKSLKAKGIVVPGAFLAGLLNAHLSVAETVPAAVSAALGKLTIAQASKSALGIGVTGQSLAIPKGVLWAMGALLAVATVATLVANPKDAPEEDTGMEAQGDLVSAGQQPVPGGSGVDEPVLLTISSAEAPPPVTGGSIEGVVLWEGRPAPNQSVLGEPYRGSPTKTFVTTTDENGRFSVEGIKPADITVTATLHRDGDVLVPPDYRTYKNSRRVWRRYKRVIIEEAKTSQLTFDVRDRSLEGEWIEGYVLVDGAVPEIAQVSVDFSPRGDDRVSGNSDEVDASGYYRINRIPPGEHFIRLNVPDDSPLGLNRWKSLTVEEGVVARFDFTVDLGVQTAVEGQVSGVRDGEYAHIAAFPGDVEVPEHYSETWLIAVDAVAANRTQVDSRTGAFRLEGLPNGTYTLVAEVTFGTSRKRHGYIDSRVVELIEGDIPFVEFDFANDDPPVVVGNVRGLHPKERVRLRVYEGEIPMPTPYDIDVRGPSDRRATQLSLGFGREIELWNLSPGKYSIWVEASIGGLGVQPYKTAWKVVDIPEDAGAPVAVEFAPVVRRNKRTIVCTMINLRPDRPEVIALAYEGVVDVPQSIIRENFNRIMFRAVAKDRVLDSPTLILTGLDPGTYTVMALQWPTRSGGEAREAAGLSMEEFFSATLIASAVTQIGDEDVEVELELELQF